MILKTFNLTKTYPDGGGVKDVSLEIKRGEFILLNGANGAGKSTLIRLISLIEPMDKGHILLGDLNSSHLKPPSFYLWRRQIGVIPQDLMLLPERTVMRNVTLGMRACGIPGGKARKIALKTLTRVGLSHKIRQLVKHLSGGEARRAAIARALCNEPFLLLADEPLGDLDYSAAIGIMELFEKINAMGTAILLVTHRQDLRPQCPYTELTMDRGKIINIGEQFLYR